MLGYFVVKDELKESACETINLLREYGVSETVMLTGDRAENAEEIASLAGVDRVESELLPEDKLSRLEQIMKEKEDLGKVVYVGDGINDAPVLARADIGIAMGAMGSDAAIEAADVVLMDDDSMKIADAVRMSKSTKRIVLQNIIFALSVKIGFMLLGAFGVANMWLAIFADVGVSVIAILNAMRTLKL